MEAIGFSELYLFYEQDGEGIREICCKPVAQLAPLLIKISMLCSVPFISPDVAHPLAYGEMLQMGSQGEEVKEIQVHLRDWGFPLNPAKRLSIDGIFNEATRAAVLEFQAYHNLRQDGIVGRATYALLSNPPDYPSNPLKQGDVGGRVREIQTHLRNWGYPLANPTPLLIDGIFGRQTQRAVREFQSSWGLSPTGTVDAKTYAALIHPKLSRDSSSTRTASFSFTPKLNRSPDEFYQEGNELFRRNRWRRALENYKRALWGYQKASNKAGIANALIQIGLVDNFLKPVNLSKNSDSAVYVAQAIQTRKGILKNLKLKDEGNGREFFQEALRIRREIGDRAGEADALIKLAETYQGGILVSHLSYQYGISEAKEPGKTINFYQQAATIYKEVEDRAKQRDTLVELDRFIAKEDQNSTKTAEVSEQAIGIYPANSKERMETFVKLAEDEYISNYCSSPEHMNYCEQALAISRVLGDKTAEQEIFSKIVLASPLQDASKLAKDLYQINADKDATREVLLELVRTSSYDEAEKSIDELRETIIAIYRDSGDEKGAADTLLKFVELNLDRPISLKYAQTKSFLEDALKVYRRLGDKEGEARALYLTGAVAGSCNDSGFCQPEKAMAEFQKSLELYRKIGDRIGEAQVLFEMASNYEQQAEPDYGPKRLYRKPEKANQALKLYQQVATIYKTVPDTFGELVALLSIAEITEGLSGIDSAKQFYHQALILADADESIESEVYCSANVAQWEDFFGSNAYLDLGDQRLQNVAFMPSLQSSYGRRCGLGDGGKLKPRPARRSK